MNKIEEMIKQLCPNGVEYVPIWKLTAWDKKYQGVDKSKQRKIIPYKYLLAKDLYALEVPDGNVKLLSTGAQEGWTTEERAGEYLYEGEVVSIPWGKSVEAKEPVKYYKGKFVTGDNRIASSLDKNSLNNKFLFYWLHANTDTLNSLYRGASIQHPCMNSVLNLEIPLPPLPIQTEIVRILDKFVEQQEQLERLIELRKKQYEYYREEMLKPKEGEVWERKTLGEIGTFVRGNGLQKTDFREEGFPCIHYGQVHTYYGFSATETKSFCSETLAEKLKKASYGDLIIATTSEDVDACCKATVWLGKGKVAISGDSYLFSHNKNPKFVAHLFRTKRFADQKRMVATGAKVVRVSGESMAKFEFQIPSSLDRQKEIADALDSFESSITALTSALESSKRRYEYYRDEMMRF